MSELTASQASVVALLSWPSCLCRDSLQRQIFATCLRPKTRPCSWSLLYLCAISVLSLCNLSDICTAFWNTNKKSMLSLCYLSDICTAFWNTNKKSVLSLCYRCYRMKFAGKSAVLSLCYLCYLCAISVLSQCYLCAISVLSLCFLCAFSPLSGHYRSKFLYSDIPPLSQQARDAQCFVSLFVVKVSMPMLRMVHTKLLKWIFG